jgi:hypothetical protein
LGHLKVETCPAPLGSMAHMQLGQTLLCWAMYFKARQNVGSFVYDVSLICIKEVIPKNRTRRYLKLLIQPITHCWWEWKLVQTLWKTIWRLLKKN